jgi:23S rRNA pseudouridine955/2504/2580 synthase
MDDAWAGQRIDNFLLRWAKGVPSSHVYRILRAGEVRVNRKRVSADYRLMAGDILRLPPLREAAPSAMPQTAGQEFPVVHEDETLLVIDKPAGVAVHGGSGVASGVIEQLRRARPHQRFLELAHRLDRETSGLLLLAKKRAVLVGLHSLFREGRVEKHYQALVSGRFRNPLQNIRLPLTRTLNQHGEREVLVDAQGRFAHSIVRRERIATRHDQFWSLIDVELKTGRTHQIRVHLAHLGHPLAGDDKYGNRVNNTLLRQQGLKRMFLHAGALDFVHPATQQTLSLRAPLPLELSRFLATLQDPL